MDQASLKRVYERYFIKFLDPEMRRTSVTAGPTMAADISAKLEANPAVREKLSKMSVRSFAQLVAEASGYQSRSPTARSPSTSPSPNSHTSKRIK